MNLKQKLSSRKFWAAIIAVVISVLVAFGADSGTQEKVTGVITSCGALICYIFAESTTDKAAVNSKQENNDIKKEGD